ncbi:MAG: toll/interleukin-1 receptor domain-containing protein [Anaerolineales bacterium]
MADQQQLEVLKQGAVKWNKWREDNPEIIVDLRRADLTGAHLGRARLKRADLTGAKLNGADLGGADLRTTELNGADLGGADLRDADLSQAHLSRTDLRGASLHGANLTETHFRGADLCEVNLRGANLSYTVLREADLREADFTNSEMVGTIFGNNDLSSSLGLETIWHLGPSTIGTDTIAKSRGKIPFELLLGCGLSDWEIEAARLYDPELSNDEVNRILYRMYDLRATQALQISPLFISYSHADGGFVDKIGDCLTKKRVRYWRDIHDMKAGRMERQIDQAIRQNPTVLLVLSRNSLSSDWVEHEVRKARSLEKDLGRDVLCPVALDDSWKSSPWPERVMEQVLEYNILDFSAWQEDSRFADMFRRLVDGLNLYYQKK